MRGVINGLAISFVFYALVGAVVYVARSHAQRGELGITLHAGDR